MAIDITDFKEFQARKAAKDKAEGKGTNVRAVQYLKADAVEAAKLTGNDQWDRFLSKVQALLNDAKAQYEDAQRKLPYIIEDNMTMQAKLLFAFHTGRAKAYEEVINLPKEIVDYYNSLKEPEPPVLEPEVVSTPSDSVPA